MQNIYIYSFKRVIYAMIFLITALYLYVFIIDDKQLSITQWQKSRNLLVKYDFLSIKNDPNQLEIQISFISNKDTAKSHTAVAFVYDLLQADTSFIDSLDIEVKGAEIISRTTVSKNMIIQPLIINSEQKQFITEQSTTLKSAKIKENEKNYAASVILKHNPETNITLSYKVPLNKILINETNDVIYYIRGYYLGVPIIFDIDKKLNVVIDWSDFAKNSTYTSITVDSTEKHKEIDKNPMSMSLGDIVHRSYGVVMNNQ